MFDMPALTTIGSSSGGSAMGLTVADYTNRKDPVYAIYATAVVDNATVYHELPAEIRLEKDAAVSRYSC